MDNTINLRKRQPNDVPNIQLVSAIRSRDAIIKSMQSELDSKDETIKQLRTLLKIESERYTELVEKIKDKVEGASDG